MFSLSRAFPPIVLASLLLILYIGVANGIRCYKCGQYNEGVGSITPCINYTAHMHLKECPPSAEWCIKYVSEGSTVRDCVPTCVEKEAWSTRTYCCQQDGCNEALSMTLSNYSLLVFAGTVMAFILHGQGLRG